jgi:hypothetical protein
MAIAAGFANHYLHVTDMILGIGLGLIFYMISVAIVQYVLHYGEAELKGKNRHITLGGGTFIVVWIMVAVLLNTLLTS